MRPPSIVAFGLLALGLILQSSLGQEISFGGHMWQVRTGQGGPGPNHWSADNAKLVNGELVLSIGPNPKTQIVECSEVQLLPQLGYGKYEFTLGADVSNFNRRNKVVFGLFLYLDDEHELDIEFARWDREGLTNADYVVQPNPAGVGGGNTTKARLWNMPPGNNTVHTIDYTADRIAFTSVDSKGKEIYSWTFADKSKIPDQNGMLVHINLWLYHYPDPPPNFPLVQATVSNFKFTKATDTGSSPTQSSP